MVVDVDFTVRELIPVTSVARTLLDLAAGLPLPQLNVLVDGESASHEVDALWPERRLIVQLDGFEYHRTRRDRERDATTDADLELAGYRVVRLTWDGVTKHRSRTERHLRNLVHRTRA